MAKYGLSQDDANRFVQIMFAVVREGIETEGVVKVKALGSFKVASVNARESVDVNTKERIIIEGRSKVTFTPDVVLRDRVNSPFAQFETVPLSDGVDFSEIDEQQCDDDTASDDEEPTDVAINSDDADSAACIDVEENTGSDLHEEKARQVASTAQDVKDKARPSTEEHGEDDEKKRCANQPEMQTVSISSLHISNVHIDNMHTGQHDADPYDAKCDRDAECETVQNETHTAECIEGHLDDGQLETNAGVTMDTSAEELKSQLFSFTKENRKLKNRCAAQSLRIKRLIWCLSCLAVFVVGMIAGIAWGVYTHFSVVEQQMTRYDMLHKDYDLLSARFRSTMSGRNNENDDMASASALNEAAKNFSKDTTHAKPVAGASASKEQTGRQQLASGEKETDKGQNAHPVQGSDKAASVKANYDSDPRVRTGAYQILGIEKTITLGKGQTLQSVSKAYLGPGMECYVEAVNKPGLKEGDKVNIPKLRLKGKR